MLDIGFLIRIRCLRCLLLGRAEQGSGETSCTALKIILAAVGGRLRGAGLGRGGQGGEQGDQEGVHCSGPGTSDGGPDPHGGHRAGGKQSGSRWISNPEPTLTALLGVVCGVRCAVCGVCLSRRGPCALDSRGACWRLCLPLPLLKASTLDSGS